MDIDALLRETLTTAMESYDVSVGMLAARSGVSRPFLGRVLKGERAASTATWSRLITAAEALAVSAELAAEGSLSARAYDVTTVCPHGVPHRHHCTECYAVSHCPHGVSRERRCVDCLAEAKRANAVP